MKRNKIAQKHIDDIVTNKIFETIKHMKFDTIIQNPPYKGSLHLDFLEKGLDLLDKNGEMVIIEPATWLIKVRKNGKAKIYDRIKQKIEGHVKSVVIENLNKEFETETQVPFAITTIDMKQTFNTIDFNCCGETKKVKSIYDCNLVGNYATILSILDKVQKYRDVMNDHIWDITTNGTHHITIMDICSNACNANSKSNATPDSEGWFIEVSNGFFFKPFIGYGIHPNYEITDTPQYAFKACGNSVKNKNYSDKHSVQLCGTKSELENWKHFIFNNKLPLFINIVMTINQNNNSKEFIPWLVDKQYTDDEINEMFGFTEEEIKLIDTTIKKYERNSLWFKRYMCGPDTVTEEEVNDFIKTL